MTKIVCITGLFLLSGCHIQPLDRPIDLGGSTLVVNGIPLTTSDVDSPDPLCSGVLGRTLNEELLAVSFSLPGDATGVGICQGFFIRCDSQLNAHVREVKVETVETECNELALHYPEVTRPNYSRQDVVSCDLSNFTRSCNYLNQDIHPMDGTKEEAIHRATVTLSDGSPPRVVMRGCLSPSSLLHVNTDLSKGCYEIDSIPDLNPNGDPFVCRNGIWWDPARIRISSIDCVVTE